jgi:hypothetical protein
MDIPTTADFQRLENKIEVIIKYFETTQPEANPILNTNQIRAALGHISYKSFQNRMHDLVAAGMFKDGQWKMKEKDLNQYINSKKFSHANN